jgi:hypothetical protein
MGNKTYRSGVSSRLFTHLKLLGFTPQDISQILSQIEIWVSASGEEWTVARLKDFKTILIQRLSGNSKPEANWIALNRQRTPKGVFKKMFEETLSTTDHRKINKALSALMVYTGYISKNVTDKQYKKSIGSIESPDILSEKKKVYLTNLGIRVAEKHIGAVKLHWRFYPASLNTGKPVALPEGLRHGLKTSRETDDGNAVFEEEKYIESFISGLSVPFVGQYLERKGELPSCMSLSPVWDDRVAASPGNISVIQERGYKARVIAMPHASIQIALYPLHQLLNQVLVNLETDCTHSQEDGATFAQRALEAGKTVYSVDLSGATDNFPRAVQIGVLKGLHLDDEAHLFDYLSGSEWKLSKPLSEVEGKDYVTYTKGQPQGMYGSFALFGLTHNLVLTEMCDKLDIEPTESFRILGDDVVITDSLLHKEYRDFLAYAKCPVSEDKCLTSPTHAEFAGFLITKDQITKPAKVPNGNAENGFMNYLKVVGYGGLKNLPGRVRSIARKAIELPESVGGLGYNPQGKTLKTRLLGLYQTTELEIPKYFGLKASLIAGKFIPAYKSDEVMVDWLIEQMSHYESNVRTLLANHKLGGISTEPHTFAFQLSLIFNDLQEAEYDYKHLAGNRDKNKIISSGSYESEFSIWNRLFTKVDNAFDKYNKDTRKRVNEDWRKILQS